MNSEMIGVFSVMIVVWIVLYVFLFAIMIASYVFQSLGLYTIAKRRNISNPVFAWIPVANMWLLGSIADHYDEKVKGVKKKSRVVLLGLNISLVAVLIFFIIAFAVFMVMTLNESPDETAIIIVAILFGLLYLALLALMITTVVFQYIALYKLFKSCHPDNAVLYLVLSIIISMALPVIVFIIRKSDDGLITEETVVA